MPVVANQLDHIFLFDVNGNSTDFHLKEQIIAGWTLPQQNPGEPWRSVFSMVFLQKNPENTFITFTGFLKYTGITFYCVDISQTLMFGHGVYEQRTMNDMVKGGGGADMVSTNKLLLWSEGTTF